MTRTTTKHFGAGGANIKTYETGMTPITPTMWGPSYSCIEGGVSQATTIPNAQTPIPMAGTFSTLSVKFATASTKNWVIALVVNGVNSALTCTVLAGALTASDLVNTVAVNAGDLVCMYYNDGTGGVSPTLGKASLLFEPT